MLKKKKNKIFWIDDDFEEESFLKTLKTRLNKN